ncbi:MAG TPA: hypothetical protein VGC87_08705 [Pyrinomonadaceae bacterium]|jgi:beta-lactamase regulating signal transducer with metallopeptidase domain
MNSLNPTTIIRTLLLAFSLSLVPLAALAQNTAPSGGGASTETTRTTTTTTTSQPTTTTRTWVDPLWLILGAVALLAIILIVVLASRGRRGTDHVATHVERETVIKKE